MRTPIHPDPAGGPGGTGKIVPPGKVLPGNDNTKSEKSPTATAEDDDVEDGDIATPKRDRYGEDDEPL